MSRQIIAYAVEEVTKLLQENEKNEIKKRKLTDFDYKVEENGFVELNYTNLIEVIKCPHLNFDNDR